MDQRISFVTLAVADLRRTHEFYVGGLGWAPELYVEGEVLMIRTGDKLVLSLWAEEGFEAEVGPIRRGAGVVPVTLAHNVATEPEVDAILELAASLGAETSRAERRDWGGYTGYFADPDGFRWEIAMNPDPTLGAIVLPDPAERGLLVGPETGERGIGARVGMPTGGFVHALERPARIKPPLGVVRRARIPRSAGFGQPESPSRRRSGKRQPPVRTTGMIRRLPSGPRPLACRPAPPPRRAGRTSAGARSRR